MDHREIPLPDGRVRRISTLYDDDAVTQKDARRLHWLQTLLDNPMMLGAYEALTIRHDGTRWIAETEILLRRVT